MDEASAFSFDMSYCGSPPTLDTLLGRWNLDPLLLLAFAVLAIAVALGLRRATRRQQAGFAGAWLISAVLFISPICALTVALFSARVGHHVVLTMIVAPLLAWALPPAWAKRVPMLPALIVSTAALWLWHAPDFYTAAFGHPAVYWAMQLSLLASFTALWMALLRDPRPLGAGLGALSSAMQMGMLGALLVFAPRALYVPHLGTTMAFGFSPSEDQQLAGLIMWVPANLPLLVLALWRLLEAVLPRREALD
ncbi:putative membrane protein [Devosia lucknowensis]|uniref:Putative membrane protein n=1 Tax=Devosia lucknowensis TaxID=1096929 RepID=A0A1Y6G5N2_9HYPH|nr:cytochrome c oxidase assembly protein [Devosia lucknowensis]SMQ85376.1 putative membrane protein [Devosia lucknowensis]